MADNEQKFYPKAKISMGAGDLLDVTDVNVKGSRGRKLVATMRKPVGGYTDGEPADEITFKSAVSEDGLERDYWSKWKKGDFVQLRVKAADETIVMNGVFDDISLSSNVGGHMEFEIKCMGKIVD
jgi:hypothetical protein